MKYWKCWTKIKSKQAKTSTLNSVSSKIFFQKWRGNTFSDKPNWQFEKHWSQLKVKRKRLSQGCQSALTINGSTWDSDSKCYWRQHILSYYLQRVRVLFSLFLFVQIALASLCCLNVLFKEREKKKESGDIVVFSPYNYLKIINASTYCLINTEIK